jgi:hypothetical protein
MGSIPIQAPTKTQIMEQNTTCPHCLDVAELQDVNGLMHYKWYKGNVTHYNDIHGYFYMCLRCSCVFQTTEVLEYLGRKYGCKPTEEIHFEPNAPWLHLHTNASVQIIRPPWINT